MGMYNSVTKNLILPFGDLVLGTQISKLLKLFEKSQWWNLKELEEYQNKRLKALIKHAYKNVPYYHDMFKSLNFTPDSIKTMKDLNKLPVLTKEEIRKNPESFLAKNIKKTTMIRNITSGSTGKVFEYMMDKDTRTVSRALGLRAWGFAGYDLGDKIVTVGGSSLLPQKISLLDKITFKANRNLLLSSYNMDKEKVKNHVQRIIEFNPKFIRGYPSSIAIIANYLTENNVHKIKTSAVMTTAETLYKRDRETISDAFDCDVFDQFGCNDGGGDLMECKEHVGYHIEVERAIHEFLDESNEPVSSNEIGHIILTDLWNYAMPFIRYDAGDMAIPTDELCSCGRELPLVKAIVGRAIERIVLPDGSFLPGLTITDIFDTKEGCSDKVLDYQIIQEKVDTFTINIVKNKGYTDKTSVEICKYFEGHMGISLNIQFNFVDKIPRTSANKRKMVLSKVKK
ncbi:MAG: phenylacetate--CoA ligase family protein [Candidatus Methanofastidiosia archaeon]